MAKPTVRIIGGGFSGLVAARAFVRRSFPVVVYEKELRLGGMIQSVHHAFGIYETAANGILNSMAVTELFKDCDVPIAAPPPRARRRFIYRGQKLKQWPLNLRETVVLILKGLKSRIFNQHLPQSEETLKQWCERVLTGNVYTYLLAPAMQGIYAGDASKLSASLLLNRLFLSRRKKVKLRGTIFPKNGMEDLIQGLGKYLSHNGVDIRLGQEARIELPTEDLWVIATNAVAAAKILHNVAPEEAKILEKIEMLPLVTVQVFADEDDQTRQGFGALFPRHSGIRSLGVLWDHSLFPQRSQTASERWILGGATDHKLIELEDVQIEQIVQQDREKLGARKGWKTAVITRWPQALPHYTVALERHLSQIILPHNMALVGNYMGAIGLSQILQKAEDLAQLWEDQFGR